MERVGNDGVITLEESKGFETTMDIVEGIPLKSWIFIILYGDKIPDKMEAV